METSEKLLQYIVSLPTRYFIKISVKLGQETVWYR